MKESLENAKFIGLTLKNIKTFEGHDTMMGFNADVYVHGKKCFHVYDSAHGGCFDYSPVDNKMKHNEVWGLTSKLDDDLKTRPEYEIELGGKLMNHQDNLEIVIDALVTEFLYNKDFKRDSKKGILTEEGNNYAITSFKAGTIPVMLRKYEKKSVALMIEGHVKKLIKDGETILNLEYLKSIGVKV